MRFQIPVEPAFVVVAGRQVAARFAEGVQDGSRKRSIIRSSLRMSPRTANA